MYTEQLLALMLLPILLELPLNFGHFLQAVPLWLYPYYAYSQFHTCVYILKWSNNTSFFAYCPLLLQLCSRLNTHYCVNISLIKAQPPLIGQLSQAWTASAHHVSASAVPELCNHHCPWMWLRAMTLWLWHHHLIEILTHLKAYIFSGFWYFHCISLATRCALQANNLRRPRS